ncbi:MAG: sigma-70 family RNA polymerase sigma factor [Nanoarchaeota archaeon]
MVRFDETIEEKDTDLAESLVYLERLLVNLGRMRYNLSLDVAQDFFQDTAYKLLVLARDGKLIPRTLRGLAYVIFTNSCMDYFRNAKRLKSLKNPSLICYVEAPNTLDKIIEREEFEKVRRVLPLIPRRRGEALSLALNGVDYKEISELLGLKMEEVCRRIRNAIKSVGEYCRSQDRDD